MPRRPGKAWLTTISARDPGLILVLGLDLLISMFVGTAALALVSAGLVGSALSLDLDPKLVVMILLALCAALLIAGKYHVFEQVSKGFVGLLLVLIVVATILVLPGVNWSEASLTLPGEFDRATLLFIIALSGRHAYRADCIGISVALGLRQVKGYGSAF